MEPWSLVVDIGGTNVRFAHASMDAKLHNVVHRETANFESLADALADYLAGSDVADHCTRVLIAAAGPPGDGEIKLTNGSWTIRGKEISDLLGGTTVTFYNDLEAAALAIPHLDKTDLATIITGDRDPSPTAARLAVNVGTGFGAATLVRHEERWFAVGGEAGHMSLAATTRQEAELFLHCDPPLQSVEDILSGTGIEKLYHHFNVEGPSPVPVQRLAPLLFERLAADPAARDAAAIFADVLARVSGDLVLASRAWGGLYLFGSVVQGWFEHCDMDTFRSRFTAKGKMSARMDDVPVHVVTNNNAPLIGLAFEAQSGS